MEVRHYGQKAVRALKILIDVLSVIWVSLWIVGSPIWTHYNHNLSSRNPDGTLATFVKVIFVSFIPFMFCWFWLIFRYAATINKKYPFIFDQRPRSRLRSRIPLVTSFFSLYLIGYLILKHTLWS